MSLGIKQQELDFEILETGNSKTLVFLDSSEYYKEPERPLAEITLPGQTKYFLVNIVARSVNTFNSNTLGLTQVLGSNCLVELPDGVYSIKFKICPYKYLYKTKYFLRTTLLQNKLKIIFFNKDIKKYTPNEERDIKNGIVDIMVDIETGKAYAELGNYKKASDFYQLANKKADRLLSLLGVNNKCY